MPVTAREAWTDERLDDLNVRMEKRFDEVDSRFDRVEADIRELRGEMKAGFDSLQRTMVIGFVTMTASIVAAVLAAVVAG
ncbi:MAG TPA: hypothetical protein VFI17_07100 [Solirubrobacterales bacterium]|nr:hypothetical protein [Solirubrobacterales bacterium]